jgi:predicted negative regulator of RcsB-dependent stress response
LTEYLTEQEQIEILKNWIKQYSLVIIAGVIIAMAGISGWRYWQQRQNKILTHASAVYNEMLTMRSQNNNQATLIQAKKLFTHYPKTTYAQMAALMLARNAEIMNDYPQAEKHLQWTLDHSRIASFREVARLRLARLLLAQHKAQAALDVLDTTDDDHFIGLIHEVRGDAYLALHNNSMAKQSYQKALEELPNAEIVRPVLRMKYDNVNTTQTVS